MTGVVRRMRLHVLGDGVTMICGFLKLCLAVLKRCFICKTGAPNCKGNPARGVAVLAKRALDVASWHALPFHRNSVTKLTS